MKTPSNEGAGSQGPMEECEGRLRLRHERDALAGRTVLKFLENADVYPQID